jgi:high-affinity nickel-transport protein
LSVSKNRLVLDEQELIPSGGAICGAFVVFGGLSVLLYKPWRRRIDRKRLRNAAFEPLGAQAEVNNDGETVNYMDNRTTRDDSKTVDVSIEPVETVDAAGPSGSRR